MKDCIGKTTEVLIRKGLENTLKTGKFNVFSSKFKKKSHFSLISGNLCLILWLEMRPSTLLESEI